MKMKKIFILNFVLFTLLGTSCDLLEPVNDNHDSIIRVYTEPAYAEGLLLNAYQQVPSQGGWSFNDVATDDAITNDLADNYLQMASGQWTAQFIPTSKWTLNRSVNYINLFLTTIDTITWSMDETANRLFKMRLRGEAYGLRGILRYYMLQDVAGVDADGQLLGILLLNDFKEENSDFNIPRATFKASVTAILEDFNLATENLPLIYKDVASTTEIPTKYDWAEKDQYNHVMGNFNRQRIQTRIVNCFRSKLLLLEASKAFNPSTLTTNDPLWVAAADASAEALKNIVLNPLGNKFFESTQVDAVPIIESDNNEMAWRSPNSTTSTSLEKDMLPPSLNGRGLINPSQNLVDAFPMADGYPRTEAGGQFVYSDATPYANRDPRLARSVIHHGLNFKGKVIDISKGKDKKDSLLTATRSGYYMRKLIREDITFPDNGTSPTGKKHFKVHVRFTEIFLNYAEAANEAGGPDYKAQGYTKSAKDVIGEIRKRAGITQPDNYLTSIGSNQSKMRELIRNERRLELCFEGFRFYDLRRWGLDLTEPAKGVNVTANGSTYSFEYIDIDKREYKPYMQYSPVPEQEILKYPNLKQNAGWN